MPHRFIALLLVAASCSSPRYPKPTDCERTLQAFVTGDIASAPPLPATCALSEIAHPALASAEDNRGTLGRAHSLQWRAVRAGIAGDELTLWHDGTKVVAMDLASPTLDWDALRAKLGEPAARFDYFADVVKREAALWVYPTRGLAFYTELAGTGVARVIAFSPTSAESFRDTLARGQEPARELTE